MLSVCVRKTAKHSLTRAYAHNLTMRIHAKRRHREAPARRWQRLAASLVPTLALLLCAAVAGLQTLVASLGVHLLLGSSRCGMERVWLPLGQTGTVHRLDSADLQTVRQRRCRLPHQKLLGRVRLLFALRLDRLLQRTGPSSAMIAARGSTVGRSGWTITSAESIGKQSCASR